MNKYGTGALMAGLTVLISGCGTYYVSTPGAVHHSHVESLAMSNEKLQDSVRKWNPYPPERTTFGNFPESQYIRLSGHWALAVYSADMYLVPASYTPLVSKGPVWLVAHELASGQWVVTERGNFHGLPLSNFIPKQLIETTAQEGQMLVGLGGYNVPGANWNPSVDAFGDFNLSTHKMSWSNAKISYTSAAYSTLAVKGPSLTWSLPKAATKYKANLAAPDKVDIRSSSIPMPSVDEYVELAPDGGVSSWKGPGQVLSVNAQTSDMVMAVPWNSRVFFGPADLPGQLYLGTPDMADLLSGTSLGINVGNLVRYHNNNPPPYPAANGLMVEVVGTGSTPVHTVTFVPEN